MDTTHASAGRGGIPNGERQRYCNSLIDAWDAFQQEQLKQHRASALKFVEEQYTSLQAILTTEMKRQVQHMKHLLKDIDMSNSPAALEKWNGEFDEQAQCLASSCESQLDDQLVANSIKLDKESGDATLTPRKKHSQRKAVSDAKQLAAAEFRAAIGWAKRVKTETIIPMDSFRDSPQGPLHRLCMKIVNHLWFQVSVACLILSNAVIIGIEADLDIKNSLKGDVKEAEWTARLDYYFYTAAFSIELILRLFADRALFFFNQGVMWNIFDIMAVASCYVDMMFQTFNLTFLRVLRIFRMLKILRILRIFRVFRDLRLMAASSSIKDGNVISQNVLDEIEEHFSGLFLSIYTLLSVISGGENWTHVDATLNHIDYKCSYVFLLYIGFVYFGVLNVLTSVFVDDALKFSRIDHDLVIETEMEREESYMNQLERLFKEIDTNDSGTVTWEELSTCLDDPRAKAYFAELEIEVSEAEGLFKLLDTFGDGEVVIEDFVIGCIRLKGGARSIDIATLMYEQKKIAAHQMTQFGKIESELQHMNEQLKPCDSRLSFV